VCRGGVRGEHKQRVHPSPHHHEYRNDLLHTTRPATDQSTQEREPNILDILGHGAVCGRGWRSRSWGARGSGAQLTRMNTVWGRCQCHGNYRTKSLTSTPTFPLPTHQPPQPRQSGLSRCKPANRSMGPRPHVILTNNTSPTAVPAHMGSAHADGSNHRNRADNNSDGGGGG